MWCTRRGGRRLALIFISWCVCVRNGPSWASFAWQAAADSHGKAGKETPLRLFKHREGCRKRFRSGFGWQGGQPGDRDYWHMPQRTSFGRVGGGSHGLAATDMPGLLSMVAAGKLLPEKLVQRDPDERSRVIMYYCMTLYAPLLWMSSIC